MRHALTLLASAALLVSLGCQPKAPKPIYGPWEEGLTLAFENPTLPQPQRTSERMQVRVTRTILAPGAPTLVHLDLVNLHGQMGLLFRHQDGGIALVDDKGLVFAQPLPVGFPKQTQWVDRGIQYRVVGRATWDGAAILPTTADPVGYWVESRDNQGHGRRVLFLPNLGEVESREDRNGTWVTVNRLVARGFTDVPSLTRS